MILRNNFHLFKNINNLIISRKLKNIGWNCKSFSLQFFTFPIKTVYAFICASGGGCNRGCVYRWIQYSYMHIEEFYLFPVVFIHEFLLSLRIYTYHTLDRTFFFPLLIFSFFLTLKISILPKRLQYLYIVFIILYISQQFFKYACMWTYIW